MGFRFRKSVKLFPGLRLNLSKSGTSWTFGGPGASVNINDDKIRGTVGIPGSGLSYTEETKLADGQSQQQIASGIGVGAVLGVIASVLLLFMLAT